MTVSDLLDQCRRDYLDDHTEMISGADDQLFRDSALVRWFNEAERKIIDRSHVLTSVGPTNPTVTQITLATGDRDYTVDPRVIRILSIRPDDSEYDLVRLDYDSIRESNAKYQSQDYFDSNSPGTATPGRPRYFSTDVALNILRVRPVPSSVEDALILNMRVAHMPMNSMTATPAGLLASPEIPSRYHHLLPLYAAAKALGVPNVDSTMRTAAKQFGADFAGEMKDLERSVFITTMTTPKFRFGGWANDGSE